MLIIETALACFTELGLDRTNMEDIQKRSGASTGSIYHHFKSKQQLAAEVYIEGIARYQEGFLPALENSTDAREGIRAAVRYHLSWIEDHPDWARFLFEQRSADFMADRQEEFARLNAYFFGRITLWLGTHVRVGTVRRLPADLYSVFILGPCQEYGRAYLSGRARARPAEIADELAEAVWRSIGT
jgi:AcrR family transcriptional regulator